MATCTDRWLGVIVLVAAAISLTTSIDVCHPIENTSSENFLTISETAEIDDVVFTITVFGEEKDFDLRQDKSNEYFAFDRKTRNVIVNATLDSDIDSLASQKLGVICTDKNTTRKVTISFIITIQDANDNAPIFTHDVYKVSIGETTSVLDEIPCGAIATDNDATSKYSQVYYSIETSKYSDYFMVSNTLKTDLTLLKALDYETLREFSITLIAKDYFDQNPATSGSVRLNDTCKVVIQVDDEDDQYPVFNSSFYRAVISNTDQRNSPVVITPPIAAYDPDKTLRAKVEYSFHALSPEEAGQSDSLFSIDGSSGEVTLLNKPSTEDIYLLLQATQVDNPSRYGVALLTVKVQGSNVNAPTFTRPSYDITRTEAFPMGQVVTTVMATDKEGSPVTYSVEDSTDTFSIDPISGDVTLQKSLSFERQPTQSFNVIASDGVLANTAEVRIKVYPAANQPPRILSTDDDLNVTVARRNGVVVVDIEAEDIDKEDTLSYRLLNHNKLFSINNDGVIRIQANEDDLVLNSYQITFVVSDGKQPSFERAAVVTVGFTPLEEPVVGASVASDDDMILLGLGAVAGLFFIIIIVLVVYVLRNRFKVKEHLDRAKKQYTSKDPKALAFKQKSLGRKTPKMNKIEFREDELDGATSVQENPLNTNTKGSYFNFGQVHSDTETEIDPNEIQIETSVVPYDHHRNDDNNNDNIYNNSQYSVESEDYNSIDKNALNSLYRNGSLSTYHESSGSDMSLNASPTDSADSKKILMSGSSSQPAHKRNPEANGGYWEINDSNAVPTISSMANSDNVHSSQPLPQKNELTVYF